MPVYDPQTTTIAIVVLGIGLVVAAGAALLLCWCTTEEKMKAAVELAVANAAAEDAGAAPGGDVGPTPESAPVTEGAQERPPSAVIPTGRRRPSIFGPDATRVAPLEGRNSEASSYGSAVTANTAVIATHTITATLGQQDSQREALTSGMQLDAVTAKSLNDDDYVESLLQSMG